MDETSKARGYDYVTIAADADRRAVILLTATRDPPAIECLAADLTAHGGDREAISRVSIDMSPAYTKGVERYLPSATITFDKFHVVAHSSHDLGLIRRAEQTRDADLKDMCWTLLKGRSQLSDARRADLDALLANLTTMSGHELLEGLPDLANWNI